MNGNRISTANHCGDTWGTVNGSAVTHRSSRCVIDNQWGSASSISLNIQGYSFSGSEVDPAFNALVYKYGRITGWTYGYRGDFVAVGQSCTVWVFRYSGGNMASQNGDSGGPYVTFIGSTYVARGTHRGHSAQYRNSVPSSQINQQGWCVD